MTNPQEAKTILDQFMRGKLSEDEAVAQLGRLGWKEEVIFSALEIAYTMNSDMAIHENSEQSPTEDT